MHGGRRMLGTLSLEKCKFRPRVMPRHTQQKVWTETWACSVLQRVWGSWIPRLCGWEYSQSYSRKQRISFLRASVHLSRDPVIPGGTKDCVSADLYANVHSILMAPNVSDASVCRQGVDERALAHLQCGASLSHKKA